jgi:hypothetical protein
MTEQPLGASADQPGDPASEQGPPTTTGRPAPDPERGLRGAMSAMLIFEALTVLLSIPVAKNTGSGTGPLGVVIICTLALAMIATCAIIRRPFAVGVIIGLQLVMVACWFISVPLGIMGVIFALCWGVIFYLRREYRRRVAAGIVPGAASASSDSGDDTASTTASTSVTDDATGSKEESP